MFIICFRLGCSQQHPTPTFSAPALMVSLKSEQRLPLLRYQSPSFAATAVVGGIGSNTSSAMGTCCCDEFTWILCVGLHLGVGVLWQIASLLAETCAQQELFLPLFECRFKQHLVTLTCLGAFSRQETCKSTSSSNYASDCKIILMLFAGTLLGADRG